MSYLCIANRFSILETEYQNNNNLKKKEKKNNFVKFNNKKQEIKTNQWIKIASELPSYIPNKTKQENVNSNSPPKSKQILKPNNIDNYIGDYVYDYDYENEYEDNNWHKEYCDELNLDNSYDYNDNDSNEFESNQYDEYLYDNTY